MDAWGEEVHLMQLRRILAALALLEALAVALTYVLDWLQGPFTSLWCWCEERSWAWHDAIKGWWTR